MLRLEKATVFKLDHGARDIGGASSPPLLAVAAEGGVSMCRPGPSCTLECVTRRPVMAVCPHPSKPLLALIATGRNQPNPLVLRSFDGSVMFEADAPPLAAGSPAFMTAGYNDCQFDASGDWLLCAAHIDRSQIEVQAWRTADWQIAGRVAIPDPFDDSRVSFHATSLPGTWALFVGAGQDGQCVYWIKQDGPHLDARLEPGLANTTPPLFSRAGHDILVFDDSHQLCRYAYPQVQVLGTCESPYGVGADSFGFSLCRLDDRWALAALQNGRIAVVDSRAMRVVNELIVEGHEPRPVPEYHPTLSDDNEICTDIWYFERIGDHLVVVVPLHRPVGGGGRARFEKRRDALLCFAVDDVIAECAGG